MKLRLAAVALVLLALAGCSAPAAPQPEPPATAAPVEPEGLSPEEHVIGVQNLWQGCIEQLGATEAPGYRKLEQPEMKLDGVVTVGYPGGTLSWNVGRGNSGVIIVDAADSATADALASVEC